MDHVLDAARAALALLETGRARTAGSLTLVPVFGGRRARDYVVASQAIAAGTLRVSELGSGTVPEIVAENSGDLPVLLIDGEHLEGAKQSRVMNASALIAPGSRTVLPVSCVEQGRWSYEGGADFAVAPDFAYGRLRGLKQEHLAASVRATGRRAVSQQAVWDDVSRRHVEAGVLGSRSGALRDAYEARRGAVDEVKRAFVRPDDSQTGVVACIDGRPVAVDAFDKPETLARLWDRLVSGYALDAALAAPARASSAAVERFMAAARAAEATVHPGIGIGDDVVLTGAGVIGDALTWEGSVVHLALFARDRSRATGGPRIGPPTTRARNRYFHGTGDDRTL